MRGVVEPPEEELLPEEELPVLQHLGQRLKPYASAWAMVPWVAFTNFNINVFDDGKFLLPVFTMGKFFERDGKRLLPLAIQVHHAVCDGYHIGVFVEKLQNYIDQF